MRQIFVLAVLACTLSPRVHAQGAWSYLEFLRSTSSEADGTRFDQARSSACGEAMKNEDPTKIRCLAVQLPKRLVGDQKVELTFKGPRVEMGQLSSLVGERGEASCVTTDSATSCLITFKDLNLDEAAVASYLKTCFTVEETLKRALYLAETFRKVPVLRYWHGIQ